MTYILLFLLVVSIEILRKRSTPIDFLFFTNAMFLFFYVIPAILLNFRFENAANAKAIMIPYVYGSVEAQIAMLVGYVLIIGGYYSRSARRIGSKVIIHQRKGQGSAILRFSLFLMVLSAVSIWIYSSQFGGISNALRSAALARRGLDAIEGKSLIFFKHFMKACYIACYLLAANLYILKARRNRALVVTLFFLSLLLSFLVLFLKAGRGDFIIVLSVFYFTYVFVTRHFAVPVIAVISVLSLFVILYGDAIFVNLKILWADFPGSSATFTEKLHEEVTFDGLAKAFYRLFGNMQHPYTSLEMALRVHLTNDYCLRWFVDIPLGIVSLLPEQLLGIRVPGSISYVNTEFITGYYRSMVPPGYLGFAIYSMGWPGLILATFAFGWILRFMQTALINNMDKLHWGPFIFVLLGIEMANILKSGDPRSMLLRDIVLIMSIYYLFFMINTVSCGRFYFRIGRGLKQNSELR
jgi:hypothetical protein